MNRRIFLNSGAAAMATLGLASPVQAAPKRATFVLVHGAWHNAGHWSRIVGPLSAAGHRVVAVDLPGHGLDARFPKAYSAADRSGLITEVSPSRDITLEQASDSVIATLRTLGPSILVGHSMGGNIISRVAEREPSLVSRLVYLTAFASTALPNPQAYMALPEAAGGPPVVLGNPLTMGAARIDPRSQDAAYIARLKASFYADVDDVTFQAFGNSLVPDQPLGYFAGKPMLTRERWGRIPRNFIRCTLDHALPIALQDRMITDADQFTPSNRFQVSSLESSHSPFASMPDRLAALLNEISS